MSTIGSIEPFDPANPDDWDTWKERLEFFLLANDVVEPGKRRAAFISVCGKETYALLKSLLSPELPSTQTAQFKPFFTRQHELSVHKGCLLWGTRVIISVKGEERVLQELHLSHPGIVRMKALARSHVWWPGIDESIERFVKLRRPCQMSRHSPPSAPIHPWEVPHSPWSRLHLDFAGPSFSILQNF